MLKRQSKVVSSTAAVNSVIGAGSTGCKKVTRVHIRIKNFIASEKALAAVLDSGSSKSLQHASVYSWRLMPTTLIALAISSAFIVVSSLFDTRASLRPPGLRGVPLFEL